MNALVPYYGVSVIMQNGNLYTGDVIENKAVGAKTYIQLSLSKITVLLNPSYISEILISGPKSTEGSSSK